MWGGLPTHSLSPALFSHLRFAAQCWSYARCPQSSPNPTSRGRIILFSIEANPDFNALPLQARLGLLFLFLPVLCPSALPHPPMGRRFSSHPGLPVPLDSATTAPHGSNGAGNRLHWCRFPTPPSKPHTGPHRGEFGSHRFFLGCFGSGSAAKSRSSL